MKPPLPGTNDYTLAFLDLAACIAGFGAAAWAARVWSGQPALAGAGAFQWAFSSAIAWLAIAFAEGSSRDGLRRWVDGFFTATGSNLLVQYGLAYLVGIPPAPWSIIVLGSGLSLTAAGLLRGAIPAAPKGEREGVLWLGYDSSTPALAAAMQESSVGVLGEGSSAAAPGLRPLGPPEQLQQVCEYKHPRSVVVSGMPPGVSLGQLLRLHYDGTAVDGAPFLCEAVLRRVAWQQLSPSDLLFTVTPITSRPMLAFQAVYKNLIGLGLLIASAPVLMLLSLLIVFSTGGPAMEHIECLGLQRIPFQMFRFRVFRSTGRPSWIGSLITRLRLTNLPQLINVVRGEMTLFGPRPVRRIFVDRLVELMPAYVYRFTVKPGILGWSQVHFAEMGSVPEEALSLEYDFYYIRQESPSLDLDILLRTLLPRSSASTRASAAQDTASDS